MGLFYGSDGRIIRPRMVPDKDKAAHAQQNRYFLAEDFKYGKNIEASHVTYDGNEEIFGDQRIFVTLKGQLIAVHHPAHHDINAAPESKKSLLPLYFKAQGVWHPTTAFIDPFNRYPILSDISLENEPIERARGYFGDYFTRGANRQIDGVKIGTDRGSEELEFLHSGRTLLNLYELTQFEDTYPNASNLALLEIPYETFTKDQLLTLMKQMQSTVKNPDVNATSREEMQKEMREILKTHSLCVQTWSDGVLIATEMPERYEEEEDLREMMEDKARKIRERMQNAYSVPIIFCRATAENYWSTKPLLYQPQRRVPKRSNQNLTLLENEQKRVHSSKVDDLQPAEVLEVSLQNMLDVFLESNRTEDPGERNRLMASHAEIAENAQRSLSQHFQDVNVKLNLAKEEIMSLSNVHSVQKKKILELKEEQLETEERFNLESKKLEEKIANLTSQKDAVLQDEDSKAMLRKQIDEMNDQFTKDKQEHKAEIDELKSKILNLNENKLDLERQIEDATVNANQLSDMSFSITEARDKLTGSTKKQRENLLKGTVKQSSPVRRNLFANLPSDDDDEVPTPGSQFMSPKRVSSSAPAINSLMLQPSKAGISKYNPAEGSIVDWFAHNRTQVEYVRSMGASDEQIVHLILMNLPATYSWISSNLTEEEKKDIDKAATKIIKLVMGSTSALHSFLEIRKGALEHPLAFLDRLRNFAEVSGQKINDALVLKLILERLETNLDPATSLELKRTLTKQPTSIQDISAALEKAIKLTSPSSQANALVNMLETTGINAFGHQRRKENEKCHNCGKKGHYASDCWHGRESSDKKDGSKGKGQRWKKKFKKKTNEK